MSNELYLEKLGGLQYSGINFSITNQINIKETMSNRYIIEKDHILKFMDNVIALHKEFPEMGNEKILEALSSIHLEKFRAFTEEMQINEQRVMENNKKILGHMVAIQKLREEFIF